MSSSPDPTDIFKWLRHDERLTSSGKLEEADVARLKAIGVEHVINLAPDTHPDALENERQLLAREDIDYIHIPVDFDAPTANDFERFGDAMDSVDGKVIHVHCMANMRVSAFLYRYRVERLGWHGPDAREEMEKLWKPGGVWAALIGDQEGARRSHLFAGRDY